MTDRRRLWWVILIASALRAAFASSLGPGNDEAYHALFAVHLDWSYFDHPPMMALIARLGMLLSGGRLEVAAMRAGFVLLAAGSTWLMARLTARFYGERAGLIAAILLNATAYYGIAAGTFILPDGPLLFFWLLTLDRLAAALETPGGLRPWVWVGLAWGGALLSKYHAVFLPVGMTLYLATEPTARRRLRQAGPYLAFALGLLIFAPVLIWNANHEWASFAFQGERARAGDGIRLDYLALAVAGQALYLLPWMWIYLWVALLRAMRRARTDPGATADRFFLAQVAAPMAAFLWVSCQRKVLPHWSLIGIIPAFCLLGRDWASIPWEKLRKRLAILAAVPVVGACLFVAQARWGVLQRAAAGPIGTRLFSVLGRWNLLQKNSDGRIELAPAADPTADMCGWEAVAAELGRRGLLDRPDEFLFTSKWYHSGHLAFATSNRVPILCYSLKSAHNFAYWEDSAAWVGHSGTLVVVNESDTEPLMYERWFQKIEPLGEFAVVKGGSPMRRVRLYRCVNQIRPFPEMPPEGRASPPRGL